jgi:hypothetical protein
MNTTVRKSLKEFWSPEKIIILFFLMVSILVQMYHVLFYDTFCLIGQVDSPCRGYFTDYIYVPLTYVDIELVLFLLCLVLIPLSLLHTWFKYIASWSIPLGLLLFVTSEPATSVMIGAPNTSPAATLTMIVQLWIILLVGFILCIAGRVAWRWYSSKR